MIHSLSLPTLPGSPGFGAQPGDANLDGKVDGADLAILQEHYDPLGANAGNCWAWGDFNGDGKIDGADLAIWQQHYNPVGEERRVLVVSNSGLDEQAIGRYCAVRKIVPRSLLRLWMPTGEDMTEADALVIWQHIGVNLNDDHLFILLMPGVPLRVGGTKSFDNWLMAKTGTGGMPDTNMYRMNGSDYYGKTFLPYDKAMRDKCGGMRLVSRLGGPTAESCLGLIDNAWRGEGRRLDGLWSIGSFDFTANPAQAYYDAYNRNHILPCATLGASLGKSVLIDSSGYGLPRQPGRQNVGAYVGWYGPYPNFQAVDRTWAPGGGAIEIYSYSASTLRDPKGSYAAKFISEGATWAVGAVAEPGLGGYPMPDRMLKALSQGLTLGEAYGVTTPNVGGQMILVGDPLFRPFVT